MLSIFKTRKKVFPIFLILFLMTIGVSASSPVLSNETDSPNINHIDNGKGIKHEIYLKAATSGFNGSYEEWVEAINCQCTSCRSIELRSSATGFLQWKYVDESDLEWKNLISLTDLAGTNGETPFIGENGNWWIGAEDTGVRAKGKSAYEIYCENFPNYTGSEQQWLDDLINGRLGNKQTYTVQFDSQGGNFISTQYVEVGSKVAKPADPIKDGSVFQGWYIENELWSFVGYVVTEDITLTARWQFEYTPGFTFTLNESNSSYELTKYAGSSRDVIIPESYLGLPVTSIGEQAFIAKSITSVAIPDSVTFIGTQAFMYCGNITKIVLPKNLITIEPSLFQLCPNLEEVIIPHGVKRIKQAAFASCGKLTRIVIPDSVNHIEGSAFSHCTSLTSIIIPDSVTILGSTIFNFCDNLETIYVIGFTYKPVGWSSVWINGCNATIVWNYSFNPDQYSTGLEFTLNEDSTYTVSGYTGTSSNVVVPESYQGLPVAHIGNSAFRGRSLATVKLPNSIISIGDQAFYACVVLTNITFGNNLVSIGTQAFMYCSNITSISLPNTLTTIGASAFQLCDKLGSINIPHGVTRIMQGAFASCFSLASIIIPNTVNHIEGSAFSHCTSLTSIVIPDSVRILGSTIFSGSENLETIYVVGFTSKAVGWSSAWLNGCSAFVVWNHNFDPNQISEGLQFTLKANETYAVTGYVGTSSNVVVPATHEGLPVAGIGDSAFRGKSISTIILPDSITFIEDKAFYSCTVLTNISFGNSLVSIGTQAFMYCANLDNVVLPDSFKTLGVSAFSLCYDLSNIVIPEGVTTIMQSAFYGCSSLISIAIPNSVTVMQSSIFYLCSNLETIHVAGYSTRPSGWSSGWLTGCTATAIWDE